MKLIYMVVLLGTLFGFSCGGDESDESNPGVENDSNLPDAQQLIADTSAAVAGLSTFSFELTHENGTTPLPLGLELESARGSVIVPDRVSAELEAEASGVDVSVDAVAIGSDTWITNPFTRQWQELDADLREFADLSQVLTSILPALQEPRVVGRAEMGGVDTYRLEGTVQSADLQRALPFTLPNREVRVEAWVGVEDSLPRRVRVIGPLVADESEDVVRQIDLFDFDEPVEIEPPE